MSKNTPIEEKFGEPLYFPSRLETLTRAVAEIYGKLAMINNFDELIETAPRLIQQSLNYSLVTVNLYDSNRQQFTLKITANVNHGQIIRSYTSEDEPNLAHHAARYNYTIRVDDLAIEAPDYYQTRPLDIHSEFHMPLVRGSRVIGVLSLGSVGCGVFNEDEVLVIIKILAAQLAVLIEQVRQHSKIELEFPPDIDRPLQKTSRPHKKSDIHNILSGIQSLDGVREVFDSIVNGVVDVLGYSGAMLAVLDEKNQRLPLQAIAFNSFIRRLNLLEQAEKILGIKVIGSSASLINDLGNLGTQSCLTGQIKITRNLYDLFQPAADENLSRWLQRLSRVKTCVSIPLLTKGQVVGNLYAGTTKKEISPTDLESLQLFVTNAAIAVRYAMLFETVNQKLTLREAELTQLRGIEKMISSSLDLHDVLKRILNGVLELTRAEYGHVVLTGKYASDLVYRVSYPDAPTSLKEGKLGITQLIMKTKQAQLIDNIDLVEWGNLDLNELVIGEQIAYDTSGAEAVPPSPQATPAGETTTLTVNKNFAMKSQLGVPISLEGELIGAINIASHEVGVFNQQHLNVLEQVAVQAAIAIRNAYQFKAEREMQKQLANAGQVVAMGDLASNMVHRINNWVGAIRADINYLKRQHSQDNFKPDEAAELMGDMLENAEATLAMAENIRKPFQSLEREPIDLNACIINILKEQEETLENVVVLKDLTQNLPPALATQQIQLVFENLLHNALQAMKQRPAVKNVLRFSTRLSNDEQWVEIIVQDSGPGLSNMVDEIDIFKLGVTSREGGMGYGLWWCDTFLKRWGGDIQLLKNTKNGCKFLVRLPTVSSAMKINP